MAEAPESIRVTREEYSQEEAYIHELEVRLMELRSRWELWVAEHPDRIIVSRTEYNGEMQEQRLLRRQLNEEWSRAMHYLAVYRWQRIRELRAIVRIIPPLSWSTLNLYRESRGNITKLQEAIRTEQARLERKLLIPPWMIHWLREIETTEAELERERERFERKQIVEYYRIHKSIKMYGRPEIKTKRTPEPVCEFTITVYTETPEKWTEEELEAEINEAMFAASFNAFGTLGGRSHKKWLASVYPEQQFEEPREVDPDEVKAPMDTKIYWAMFYRPETEYGDAEVRRWIRRYREYYGEKGEEDLERMIRFARQKGLEEFMG